MKGRMWMQHRPTLKKRHIMRAANHNARLQVDMQIDVARPHWHQYELSSKASDHKMKSCHQSPTFV